MKRIIGISCLVIALIASSCSADGNNNDAGDSDSTALNPSAENKAETAQYIYGIDISSFQGNEVAEMDKRKDSLTFVICRATDGITWVDPDFKSNWKLISEKGFVKGAYHFFESEDDPEDQVENYFNHVGEINAADMPPIVDFEGGGIRADMTVEAVQNNLLKVLELLAEKTKRKPILYTNISKGNKYLNLPVFADYTLWIADPVIADAPTLPAVWKDTEWVLWQKSDSVRIVDNIKNDYDQFNGNLDAFNAFLKLKK